MSRKRNLERPLPPKELLNIFQNLKASSEISKISKIVKIGSLRNPKNSKKNVD